MRNCRELPGQKLFGFHNDDGGVEEIDSNDVNEYIRAIAGDEFSAKYFRTWAGTLLAARALSAVEKAETKTEEKQRIATAITEVADRLGNTPTVCRNCYVHPAVLDMYADGLLRLPPPSPPSRRPKTALSAEEKALRRLLRKHAKSRRT